MPALFDTGALELLRRRDPRLENLALKNYPPVLCPHVAGEYIHSQLQARVSPAAIVLARTFLAAFETLTPTTRTADHYAELRDRLIARDIILPDPYCWIAAHAIEHRLPLVTTDRAFRQLPGLKVHLIVVKKRRTRASPATDPNGKSGAALGLLALYLAQDYLAESSALLENLGNAAGAFS